MIKYSYRTIINNFPPSLDPLNSFRIFKSFSTFKKTFLPPNEQDQTLMKHLETFGGRRGPLTIGYSKDNRRGVFATKDIKNEEILSFMPGNRIISEYSYKNSTIQQLLPFNTNKNSSIEKRADCMNYLTCFLLYEYYIIKEESPWYLWIDSFPKEVINGYTLSNRPEIKNTGMQPIFHSYKHIYNESLNLFRKFIKNHPKLFQDIDELLPLHFYLFSMLTSRGVTTEDHSFISIPFFDFINHPDEIGKENVTFGSIEDGSYYIQSLRDISEGEEVFFSYGDYTNQDLLCTFGFTQKGAPSILNVEISCPKDKLGGLGAKILRDSGILDKSIDDSNSYYFVQLSLNNAKDIIIRKILPVIRYLSLEDTKVGSSILQSEGDVTRPLDLNFEKEIRSKLVHLLESHKKLYFTTLEEDIKSIGSKGYPANEIIKCSIEEKQLLNEIIKITNEL